MEVISKDEINYSHNQSLGITKVCVAIKRFLGLHDPWERPVFVIYSSTPSFRT
jgi:hypothetical protein